MTQPKAPRGKDSGTPGSRVSATIKENRASGLLRSSGIVGLMTLLSRVLGLVRDIVVAGFFGASAGADAFFVAFKIPNFFRRLFAEGAFSQAFIPVFSEYKTQIDSAAVKQLASAVMGVLGLVLLLITGLAMLGAPWITALFAPGFIEDAEKYNLASDMLRITFPYLMLISLTAYAGSMLNSYGYFAIPAFTPVLLNVVLISAAIYLTPMFDVPVIGLAWGVMLAGMIQLLFQLPFLLRIGLLPRPSLDYRHEGVQRIFRLMLPALFGVSVSQINLLLDTVLASFLQTGSISWLYYSDRLAELPLGVFGIAIATVILPSLSGKHASQSVSEFSRTIDWALKIVLLLGVPAAIALIVLAEPLLTSLFYYGAMTEFDITMSAQSLRAYALGLMAFMFIKVLATGYFSRQDMKTPVKIGIWAMTANMVFNLILIWPLQHAGLALATALSSWMNAGLLLYGLKKSGVYTPTPGWWRFLIKVSIASLAMIALVDFMNSPTAVWFELSLWGRVMLLSQLVVAGIVSYFILLVVFRLNIRSILRSPASEN